VSCKGRQSLYFSVTGGSRSRLHLQGGGEDQRTPPRAGGRRRNATVSLYRSPTVYPFISAHAQMHARTSRAIVAVLCICLCVYGGESSMRHALTVCIVSETARRVLTIARRNIRKWECFRYSFERISLHCII